MARAGVDRLVADATLPEGVPIARMVDPAMTAAMSETALWAVLAMTQSPCERVNGTIIEQCQE